jgi:hypothetical protein
MRLGGRWVNDVIMPSPYYTCHGRVSGASAPPGQWRKQYIAPVPLSRYNDPGPWQEPVPDVTRELLAGIDCVKSKPRALRVARHHGITREEAAWQAEENWRRRHGYPLHGPRQPHWK